MLIQDIQNWFAEQCNGDWEHTYGIEIESLDNPGWSVKIDLNYTDFQASKFILENINDENDWISIKIEDDIFKGYGDPHKLELILQIFYNEFINNPFYKRSPEEQEWFLLNTWCSNCGEADVGITNPKEYIKDKRLFIAGLCVRCGHDVVSEITDG
jgi:hypothetical protein